MAQTSVVATFPPGYFLENIAVDHDSGLVVTCANRQELFYVSLGPNGAGSPHLLHRFERDQWPMGIVAAPSAPGVFYILTTDFTRQQSGKSHLQVLDFANVAMGAKPYPIMEFPPEARGLNGLCALSGAVLLAADSFASCIWRVELAASPPASPSAPPSPPASAHARVWLSHPTMAGALTLPDFQPGVNGLKFSRVTGRAYFTSTQQRLVCQVRVDSATLEASGEVEVVAKGMQADDLLIDDAKPAAPAAYVATHRDNTVVRVPLDGADGPRATAEVEVVTAAARADGGLAEEMLGPTAGAWAAGREGRAAYFTNDGGLKNPPRDGRPRRARIVRLDL